jgi:hypothetical protein
MQNLQATDLKSLKVVRIHYKGSATFNHGGLFARSEEEL